MLQLLVVGLGGFVGAVARWGVSGLVLRWTGAGFPYATLVVNLVGCLVIGAVMGVVELRPSVSDAARAFVTVGLLGSFTTFSTFGHETFVLLRTGQTASALGYVLLSVTVGLAAVVGGRFLARALIG